MQTINKKILIVTGVILLGIIVIGAILWTDREESMRQRGGAGKQSYTAQTPDPTAAPVADEEEILSMVHRKDYLQVKLDQKKQTIKVSWEALTNAQEYRLTRYRVRDDKPDPMEMTKTYKPENPLYFISHISHSRLAAPKHYSLVTSHDQTDSGTVHKIGLCKIENNMSNIAGIDQPVRLLPQQIHRMVVKIL